MTDNNKISLFSAIALCMTSMIGSGWLFSAALGAKYAGNWSFLAFVIAGLFAMSVGMCLSVVVSVYPVSGIITRSSSLSHNKLFGMPFAFANWFGTLIVVATEAQATGQYLFAIIKSKELMINGVSTVEGRLVELGLLVVYLLINFYGIKILARVNNIVIILKVFTPIFAIVVLLLAHFDKSNFSLLTNNVYHPSVVFHALIAAGLVYSFNGFQSAAAFAGEIENPKRNVPLAIMLSIVGVVILYSALEFVFMGSVPHSMLLQGWSGLNFTSPLVNLAMLLGLNFLVVVLLADSVVSPSGTGYTYLGSTSRMLYAMAKEGQMPKWLGVLSRTMPFPKRALIVNFILAAVVLMNSGSWVMLMVIVTGCNIIGYMAAPISMGALKPNTRIFGAIIFVLITLLMTTLPVHDMLIINIAITGMMVIYLLIQFETDTLAKIVRLVLPFLVYLWAFCFIRSEIVMVIIAVAFYALATHKKYVAYCVKLHPKTELRSDIDYDTDKHGV